MIELGAYVNVGTDLPVNEYDSLVTYDLSADTGTFRIAFIYKYTDGYQMMVDDIMILKVPTESDEPTSYEIYRWV